MTAEIPKLTPEQITAQEECLTRIRQNAKDNSNHGIGITIGSLDVLNLANLFGISISDRGRDFLNTHELDIPRGADRYTNITRENLAHDAHDFVKQAESLAAN